MPNERKECLPDDPAAVEVDRKNSEAVRRDQPGNLPLDRLAEIEIGGGDDAGIGADHATATTRSNSFS